VNSEKSHGAAGTRGLFARAALPLLLAAACAGPVKPIAPPKGPGTPHYSGPPLVRWAFETIEKSGESYTRAFIVVTEKTTDTYTVGTFYGGVARVMVRGEAAMDRLPEDALSGFIIFTAGAGHEVYAGYDPGGDSLYIKSRKIWEGGGTEAWSAIKTIPLKGRGRPVPVK